VANACGEAPAEPITVDEIARRARVARVARRLHEQGCLRADVTVPQARAVLWLLAGFDAYDALATGQGLAPGKIAEILVAIAESALLAEA
jgi:hypothetical protein